MRHLIPKNRPETRGLPLPFVSLALVAILGVLGAFVVITQHNTGSLAGFINARFLAAAAGPGAHNGYLIAFSDQGSYNRVTISEQGGAPSKYECGGKTIGKTNPPNKLHLNLKTYRPGKTSTYSTLLSCTATGKGHKYAVTFQSKQGSGAIVDGPTVNVDIDKSHCTYVHSVQSKIHTVSFDTKNHQCAAANSNEEPQTKRQAVMTTVAAPKSGNHGVKGMVELSAPNVNLSHEYCTGNVFVTYAGSKGHYSKTQKLRYARKANVNNGNGYCAADLSKKLPPGRWSVSASFPGNVYLKRASAGAVTVGDDMSGSNATPVSSSTSSPLFRVASYNVLGAHHTDPGGNSTKAPWDQRMAKATGVIMRNRLDIVGLQEFEDRQRSRLVSLIGNDYDIYPATADYSDAASENSIIWNRSKFSLVGSGFISMKYINGNTQHDPWVRLQYKDTGKQFYVFNAHYPTAQGGLYAQSPQYREEDAKKTLAEAEDKYKTGLPVLLLGDLNSSFGANAVESHDRSTIPYCILTSTGHFRHALDVVKQRYGTCPASSGGGIDHVFVSDKVNVAAWGHLVSPDANIASDHNPAVAILSF